MKSIKLKFPEVLLIEPQIFKDERGFFYESFNQDKFEKMTGKKITFVQDNYSKSNKNTLRGMHYQKEPYGHEKLVSCIHGKALDVCIDLRTDSKSFGFVDHVLIEPGKKSLLIPRGVAHGFYALSDITLMAYFTSSVYNPDYDSGVLWSSINFEWPNKHPIVSERDSKHPIFKDKK